MKRAKRANYRVTFAVVLVGIAAYSLLQSLALPALPTIQHTLHTSQGTVTWVLTAYLLSASVFTPILGRAGDLVGKGRVFVVTLGALALGSLLAALANSIGTLIAARAIQGIGGGVLPLAFGIIRDEFPAEKVPPSIGAAAGLTAVGSGLGIIFAGPIVDLLGFHWLFWIPMIMVLLAAVAGHFLIPACTARTEGRIGWTAALLLTVWLVALLLVASEGGTWGWRSNRVDLLVVLAAVGFVAWLWVELHSAHPLVDIRMMRLPVVWTCNLVALLFGVGMYTVFVFIPEYVHAPTGTGYGLGASNTGSGLFLFPLTALMFVGGLLSGRAARRLGAKRALCFGALLSVPPFAMLAIGPDPAWEIYAAMGLLGGGFGVAYAVMSNLVIQAVPASQTGVASGMNTNIRTIGGSIGAAVMIDIVTAHLGPGGLPMRSGYAHGFAMLTVVAVFAALAAFAIPSRQRPALSVVEAGDSERLEGAIIGAALAAGEAD